MQKNQQTPTQTNVYQDPPDIPDDDLNAIVRKAFADVGKKHERVQKEFQKKLYATLIMAAQDRDTQ